VHKFIGFGIVTSGDLFKIEESNNDYMIKLISFNYDILRSSIENLLYCMDAYQPLFGTKVSTTFDED
jgi:hypothetical protein